MEPVTLSFEAFDIHDDNDNINDDSSCGDWIEINDGTSTQRYCNSYSSPGTVTGTNITVKFHSNAVFTANGFFAVVSGNVTVTTDLTGESKVCIMK